MSFPLAIIVAIAMILAPCSLACQANQDNGINWQADNWAFACDFHNNDISSVQVESRLCGPTCEKTQGCTHFTWAHGTCWMKSGQVSASDAFDTRDNTMVCGFLAKPVPEPAPPGPSPPISKTAHRFSFVNKCRQDIYVGSFNQVGPHPNNGGWLLQAGATSSVDVPQPFVGRFWPRTGCSYSNGRFHCETGDCGPKVQCAGSTGEPPATLAELTLKSSSNGEFYDVS